MGSDEATCAYGEVISVEFFSKCLEVLGKVEVGYSLKIRVAFTSKKYSSHYDVMEVVIVCVLQCNLDL